jgi:hypothetical protein
VEQPGQNAVKVELFELLKIAEQGTLTYSFNTYGCKSIIPYVARGAWLDDVL